jgi:DUF4097 and DUF4098 domain-containing protein YvlB
MPIFTTPGPIDLAIHLPVGAVDVIASDRTDTVVTVSPTNPARELDRKGAEATTVEFDGERLTITGPKPRFTIVGPSESIDIRVELPSGSRLTADAPNGPVRTTGALGATRIKNSMGPIDLETTGDLWLRAGHGNVKVGTANGDVEITADHGQIRLGAATGESTLKASHGSITVAESGGDLEAKLSYGDLEITRALAGVTAKTAYGSIQLLDVSSGAVSVDSGYGQIRIGVRAGVPAWLDLSSKNGHVRNQLDTERAPEPTEQTVAVRARTQYGDITIERTNEGKQK